MCEALSGKILADPALVAQLESTINNRMSKPVPIEDSVKPLYEQLTKAAYETRASWVNTRKFTIDPVLASPPRLFELDTELNYNSHWTRP